MSMQDLGTCLCCGKTMMLSSKCDLVEYICSGNEKIPPCQYYGTEHCRGEGNCRLKDIPEEIHKKHCELLHDAIVKALMNHKIVCVPIYSNKVIIDTLLNFEGTLHEIPNAGKVAFVSALKNINKDKRIHNLFYLK